MNSSNLYAIKIKKILSVHYYELALNYQYEGESHNFWEIVYVDKGNVRITSEKDTFYLKEGEMYFHQPNEFHSIGGDNKTASNVFILSFACNSKNMDFFKKRKIQIFPDYNYYINKIINISKETYKMSISQDSQNVELREDYRYGGPQLIRSFLELMFIMILRNHNATVKNSDFSYIHVADSNYVYNTIKLLEENIYGKITVEEICKKLNLSRVYISRIFKEKTGTTINEYYRHLKINEAKKLLSTHIYSVSQVSDMLCFNTPRYFSKVFKSIAGILPKEYINI